MASEICVSCHGDFKEGEDVLQLSSTGIGRRTIHKSCLHCAICKMTLSADSCVYEESTSQVICLEDFMKDLPSICDNTAGLANQVTDFQDETLNVIFSEEPKHLQPGPDVMSFRPQITLPYCTTTRDGNLLEYEPDSKTTFAASTTPEPVEDVFHSLNASPPFQEFFHHPVYHGYAQTLDNVAHFGVFQPQIADFYSLCPPWTSIPHAQSSVEASGFEFPNYYTVQYEKEVEKQDEKAAHEREPRAQSKKNSSVKRVEKIGGLGRRNRATISEEARQILIQSYRSETYPSRSVRTQLSAATGLDPRQVQVWFQNQRRIDKVTRRRNV